MSSGAALVIALERLEKALAAFSAAYQTWLREGGDNAPLSELLTGAEAQLDAARPHSLSSRISCAPEPGTLDA